MLSIPLASKKDRSLVRYWPMVIRAAKFSDRPSERATALVTIANVACVSGSRSLGHIDRKYKC